jgi:acetyl esterase/lipase
MNKRNLFSMLLISTLALLAMTEADTPKELLLWPNGAPGSEGKTDKENVRVTEQGEHVISSVHAPSITLYLPSKENATGTAIIIAPGGGHRELWIDHEGHNPARWFQERGVAALVLKYRLAKEANSPYTIDGHALIDMQRAIRYVRSHAEEWSIDPHKIGVMGFSAGGEVAALSAMRFDEGLANSSDKIDQQACRPDFQALVYPGNSSRFDVNEKTPPVFIVCGYNDRDDIALGMAQLYEKYKLAKVPAELHIYAKPGHGFGLRSQNQGAITGWPARLEEWMVDMNFLQRPQR